MPRYSYTTWSGNTVEHSFPMAARPEIVLTDDGWPAYRDFAADWSRRPQGHGDLWPRWSDAAGVNPDQIGEAMAVDKQLGVPTRYNELGQVEFTSRRQEKRWCEAHGYYQRNSYGGLDAQRK